MSKLHSNPTRAVCGVVRPLAVDTVEGSVGVDAAQWPLFSTCTLRTRAPPADMLPADNSRVAELRAAVLGGTYKADAQKIADRLIFSEKGTGMTIVGFLRGLQETLESDRSALIANAAERIGSRAVHKHGMGTQPWAFE